jgi:hypothetical protein
MWNQFLLALNDIYESYATIRAVDLAQPSFIALWMVILFTPLLGIDRRDHYCSAMYVAYLAGAGVALIFALPRQYIEQSSTLAGQISGTIMMMIVASVRWYLGSRQPLKILRKINSGETKEAVKARRAS